MQDRLFNFSLRVKISSSPNLDILKTYSYNIKEREKIIPNLDFGETMYIVTNEEDLTARENPNHVSKIDKNKNKNCGLPSTRN
jgi:hypothetical protein